MPKKMFKLRLTYSFSFLYSLINISLYFCLLLLLFLFLFYLVRFYAQSSYGNDYIRVVSRGQQGPE